MTTTQRTFLALLLVACLCASFLPLGALAGGGLSSEKNQGDKDDGDNDSGDKDAGADAFKDQASQNEMFRAVKRLFEKRDPGTLDRFGASPDSLDLLEAYDADSLGEIPALVFFKVNSSTSSGAMAATGSASTSSSNLPDEEVHLTGMNIEVAGAKAGTDVDNSWETCSGGELNIETTETTVGADQFHTFSPGHTFVGELNLRGPMKDLRKPLTKYYDDQGQGAQAELQAYVKTVGTNASPASVSTNTSIAAFAVHWFKDQVLIATIDAEAFGLSVISVNRTDGQRKACPAPSRMFLMLPSSGPSFMPLGIGGTGFDNGSVPYFGTTPSVSLFNFALQNIPLIGSIAVGFTIVPPAAPSGTGEVTVETGSQTSNGVAFNVSTNVTGHSGGTGGGSGSPWYFATLLTFQGRVASASGKNASRFSTSVECQTDWANSTMPGPKQDLIRGMRLNGKFKEGGLSLAIDGLKSSATDLKGWFDGDANGKVAHRHVKVMDTRTQTERTYNLVDCFPISFTGGDFTTGAESNLAELHINATRVELA